MNLNDDEAIGLLNRLLERLHQADLTNFGSHLQIVYVASGAQHVETQINMGEKTLHKSETLPSPPCVGREKETSHLPEVLATDEAMALWKKARHRKYMRSDYNLALTRKVSLDFQNELKRLLG